METDPLILSRIQFAANISFHILFPTITIALGWMLLFFKWRFSATGDTTWMRAYFTWVKVFALTFAMGVVSGVTMSFQFGTNWPGYMQKVGNIAGPLLAYEILTAFFLEAAFLGIMLFGFRRVSNRVHTLATLLVAVGTTLSAVWILALNSWMQTPAGFEMRDGIAYPTDWWAIIFNPSFPYRLVHMLLASGLTVSFLIAGMSALRYLRGDRSESMLKALRTAVTVDAEAGEIEIDFEGSSGPSSMGINVVPAYTHAYATFAVRSSLNPDLPNNAGSLAPIRLKLPEQCIVNAKYPSPVNARHVVGMYVPFPILKALAQVVPEAVVAEGSGAVWTVQIQGRDKDGQPFTSSMFNYSGGMGARATKPGISAVCYPTGVSAVPVEVLEASYPIAFTCKELAHGTGGAGAQPGGDGQRIGYRMRTGRTWLLNTIPSRLKAGPEGLLGGEDGQPGTFRINGEAVEDTRKREMQPDDEVFMITPGGGGYGAAQ